MSCDCSLYNGPEPWLQYEQQKPRQGDEENERRCNDQTSDLWRSVVILEGQNIIIHSCRHRALQESHLAPRPPGQKIRLRDPNAQTDGKTRRRQRKALGKPAGLRDANDTPRAINMSGITNIYAACCEPVGARRSQT